ncbi:MAG: hypothetical protein HC845_06020 [Akkermansiaceae bacterium]|nr:hypothetical protein [Akkermansiaceae bacterium]
MIDYLIHRDDLVIVPRFQFYWRHCIPKIENAWVVSYHTQGQKNSKHLHIQEAPLAGRCSFDDAGFAGFSSIATNHSAIEAFTAKVSAELLEQNQKELYQQYVVNNVSKYKQSSETAPITEPYVFVALQISTDVVSRLAWISGIEMLQIVAEYYRSSGTRVVVKRHPYCGSMSMQKCLDELEENGSIIRASGSIHQLISSAKLVLTVNSGVGLEALIHNKPVIVSGRCDYSYATQTVKTRTELFEALTNTGDSDPLKRQQLLYYYVHQFTLAANAGEKISARLQDWLSDQSN